MTQSTVYPEKIKILGDKVYVRDLDSVAEKTNEQDNIIYTYDEDLYTKDEYIKILKNENDMQENVISDLVDLLIDKGVIY